MKLTEQKLRKIIREEIISENIIKNFIEGFREEYNKWKSAVERIWKYPGMPGANTTQDFIVELIVVMFGFLAGPIYGLTMLGPTLYKKYKKKMADAKRDKKLSSEEYQKKLVEIATELYTELPTGKKRYIQGLINKMENKETEYARELDDYLKRQLRK